MFHSLTEYCTVSSHGHPSLTWGIIMFAITSLLSFPMTNKCISTGTRTGRMWLAYQTSVVCWTLHRYNVNTETSLRKILSTCVHNVLVRWPGLNTRVCKQTGERYPPLGGGRDHISLDSWNGIPSAYKGCSRAQGYYRTIYTFPLASYTKLTTSSHWCVDIGSQSNMHSC